MESLPGTAEVGECAGADRPQRRVAERLVELEEGRRLRDYVWVERLAKQDVGAKEVRRVYALSAPPAGEETLVADGVPFLRPSVSHMYGGAVTLTYSETSCVSCYSTMAFLRRCPLR